MIVPNALCTRPVIGIGSKSATAPAKVRVSLLKAELIMRCRRASFCATDKSGLWVKDLSVMLLTFRNGRWRMQKVAQVLKAAVEIDGNAAKRGFEDQLARLERSVFNNVYQVDFRELVDQVCRAGASLLHLGRRHAQLHPAFLSHAFQGTAHQRAGLLVIAEAFHDAANASDNQFGTFALDVSQTPSKQFGLGYKTSCGIELRLADPFGIAACALGFINSFRITPDAARFGLRGLQDARCLVEPCRLTLRQDMAASRQGKIELLQP